MITFRDNKIGRRVLWLGFLFYCFTYINLQAQDCEETYLYEHPIAFNPQTYVAIYTAESPIIDGKLDEVSWEEALFSEVFKDIEGELRVNPERKTKIKILWDSSFLYIAAILEEDHIWATLTEKDAIIFHDDDFEVFIDADGDGHNYQEFEMNAFNTVWDLWLMRPYSVARGKNYLMEWEAKGWKTAVQHKGSINDPSDTDEYWTVEMAIPLHLMGEIRTFWRINFSRVDWLMNVVDGEYVKKKGEKERNWVWSPTGFVNMHKPETWGYLFFEIGNEIPDQEYYKWEMWKIYYAVKRYRKKNRAYPSDLNCFTKDPSFSIESTKVGFDLYGEFKNEKWHINELARITKI